MASITALGAETAYERILGAAYELFATNVSFSGGNSGSFDNQLFFGSLPGGAATHYIATYQFRAVGATSTDTTLSPVVDIASGPDISGSERRRAAG